MIDYEAEALVEASHAVVKALPSDERDMLLCNLIQHMVFDGGGEVAPCVMDKLIPSMPEKDYYTVDHGAVLAVAHAANAVLNMLPGGGASDSDIEELARCAIRGHKYGRSVW